MGNNVLYFPYIEVPENTWFTQVLLYWDKVGSIVPSKFLDLWKNADPGIAEVEDAKKRLAGLKSQSA